MKEFCIFAVGNICCHSDHNLYIKSMENAVVQQIRKMITRSKFGEIFFVSSFPQYDVEYVTKLLAIFEKEGLVTRIAKGVYVKARKTRHLYDLEKLMQTHTQKWVLMM